MARFEDFTQCERHVLLEAMAWSQSEFYDPGHTSEDRETLQALITEAKAAEIAAHRAAEPPADAPGDVPGKDVGSIEAHATEATRAPERAPVEAERPAPWYLPESQGRPTIKKPTRKVLERPAEYKGFLLIKCSQCGNIHAFCAKVPMSVYRCRECGGRTPLTDMTHLQVVCECGARHGYMTNVTEKQMDVTCFSCGAPVAVEWNEKLGKYTTIGANTGRPHKKKGGGK